MASNELTVGAGLSLDDLTSGHTPSPLPEQGAGDNGDLLRLALDSTGVLESDSLAATTTEATQGGQGDDAVFEEDPLTGRVASEGFFC